MTCWQRIKQFPIELFLAIDQLLNVLLLGAADETLSARSYRADRDGKVFGRVFRPMIDALFFWQDTGGLGHCRQAYEREKSRFYLPKDYSR